ncbi:hypothetical protein FB567DRAFT_606344 [Paraphoma chrysanthemicola]|uniref:Uncharacterized protein n=1 Tax=Paraphoma chrysanthemicola TaxID=798071 RepID=A0A8K0R056_9PLEO|nr:hypothetical protein FB567DRAFT_606344 [Paraphoma chrysanthemicola]
MSDPQPFRVLDLPTEIRLMVYERLPTMITHHSTAYFGLELPHLPVLIYLTIAGINILATCSQINNEAGAVLKPRLIDMRKSPVRMTVDSRHMRDSYFDYCIRILKCLSHGDLNCSHIKDWPTIFTQEETCFMTHTHTTNVSSHLETRHVEIAWKAPKDPNLLDDAVGDLCLNFDNFCDDAKYYLGGTRESIVKIRVRPALLASHGKAIFERIQPFESSPFWTNYVSKPKQATLRIEGGDYIEKEEWQKDWAEGELLD